MIGRFRVIEERGPLERSQEGVVCRGDASALARPVIKVPRLDVEHGALDALEPEIEPKNVVPVFLPTAMVTQQPQLIGDRGVVGDDRSALAAGTEIFPRVKAKCGRSTCADLSDDHV